MPNDGVAQKHLGIFSFWILKKVKKIQKADIEAMPTLGFSNFVYFHNFP